jgi:hypothetical protein
VELETHPDEVAVRLSPSPDAIEAAISKVVRPSHQKSVMQKISLSTLGDGDSVAVIPRSALRDESELRRGVERGDLPRLFPLYESHGSLMIPLGTITCRLISPADEPKLMEQAETFGLEKVPSTRKGELKFRLTDRSKFPTVWEACRNLQKTRLLRWCEPDLGRSIKKFVASSQK